jgi:hypothetical protein
MFILPNKNNKKNAALIVINAFLLAFILIAMIVFSWLFLFVYKYLYSAVVQETAILNLRSQLIVTKVHKTEYEAAVKQFEDKINPSTTIIFNNIANPFLPPDKK